MTFLGVGDATDPSGGTTSVLYRGKQTVLVDCGPAIPSRVNRLLPDPDALDAVWITHQHADHCFGLPNLLLTFRVAQRKKPLAILGGPGMATALNFLIELGYPRAFSADKCFPIRFADLEPEHTLALGELRLATAPTQHNADCFAVRIDDGERRLCVSGDGKLTAATLSLYRQADLVAHECQTAVHRQNHHSCLDDLQPLVTVAEVHRVALVHYNWRERDAIAERARQLLGPRAFMPQAGDTVPLGAAMKPFQGDL